MNSKTLAAVTTITFVAVLLITVISGAAMAQTSADDKEAANLHIVQESYVDQSVGVNDTGDIPVYDVHGAQVYITPLNFDTDNVIDFRVDGDDAELSFDERAGHYTFDPFGGDGTYELVWLVEEEEEVQEGNQTSIQVEQVRYSAIISISGTRVDVFEEGEFAQMREDAANWSAWESAVLSENVAGPEADIETETQSALNYLRVIHNPLEALTGEFTAVLLLLFMSLGGLVVLLFFGAYHLWTTWYEKKYVHKTESLEAEREDIESRFDSLKRKERQQALANTGWDELFPNDEVAAAFRETFGETLWDGSLTLQEIFLPQTLIRDRLEAMGLVGHEVDVEREGGEIVAATILDASYDEDDATEIVAIDDLDDDELDQLVEAVDWSDPVLVDFDMVKADFDRDDMGTVLESPNSSKLLLEVDKHLGPDGRFTSRKEYLQYITEFVEDVVEHDYTTSDGGIKPVRHMLNSWLKMSHVGSDKHGFPQLKYIAEYIQLILLDQDIGAEVQTYVEEVNYGRHT